MQILSVALTNFKTHKEQQFHFQPGTNAICGENGAGKTSILEAIAWTLFNYQGSYKKEDLIRNGASSAQVRVAFISNRDSRTYEVQRSTTSGYTIYDPQLAEKLPITRTKDEVLPWLRQNLGVAPGTDLGQLFANTIGVPQGTFTADFLLSTEKRKPIFDTILKVEEYRQTYKQSNSLRRYAEAQVQRLKDLIAQYEESLQSWDELQNRSQQLQTEITQGNEQLTRLEAQAKALAQQRQTLVAQSEQVQQTQNQLTLLTHKLENQQQAVSRLGNALQQAESAAQICKEQQKSYDQFLAAEAQLKELGIAQKQQQKVLQQQQQVQQSLAASERERSKLELQQEQLKAAEQALNEITQQVIEQTQLEHEQATLQKQAQTFANLRFQQNTLTQQTQQLAQDIQLVEADLQRLADLQSVSDRIPEWEQQQTRIQEQLSRLSAARQFEQELKSLSETAQARQDSYREQVVTALATLEGWVDRFEVLAPEDIMPIREALFEGGILSKETLAMINGILADLGAQTDPNKLQAQQQALQKQLKQAYAQQAELAGMEKQEKRRAEIAAQHTKIQKQLSDIQKQLATEGETSTALQQVEQTLKTLDNPKGKQQLLEKTLQNKAAIEQQYQMLEASRIAGLQQLDEIAAQLKTFEQLVQTFQQREAL